MLAFGLVLPAVLFFYALVTAGPIETGTATHVASQRSQMLFMVARLTSTAATFVVVLLTLLGRRHGVRAFIVFVPGIVAAAAALLLWEIEWA